MSMRQYKTYRSGIKMGISDALLKGIFISLLIVAVGFLLYSTIFQFVVADIKKINAIEEIISLDSIYY